MLFNSFAFLFIFLPLVLVFYFLLEHRNQNKLLVFASCVFYAFWDWKFLFPLLITTSIDFFIAKKIHSIRDQSDSRALSKHLLRLSIVSNLSLLAYFKYFNFFSSSLKSAFDSFGWIVSISTYEIVLPLAISFYTFQALSYTIDVYRGEIEAGESFWDFFLAVLYFPHLVAGPIQRAASLLPQISNPRKFEPKQFQEGVHLIVWGLFKKIFIADNLSPIADRLFLLQNPTGAETFTAVFAFTFQIYCDFSGYTDIARGIAKLMGIEFQLNFNLPYFAKNPSDFWRRWHISLSEWLRDYLYKSLGGNRFGSFKTNRNLMITMVLGGLWHGAAWNFIIWGVYHGIILCAHRILKVPLATLNQAFIRHPKIWSLVQVSSMFLLTMYGWLLFRATSLDQIVVMTTSVFGSWNWTKTTAHELLRTLSYCAPLVAIQIYQYKTKQLIFIGANTNFLYRKMIAYSVLLYLMLFFGGRSESFIYFQF